MGNRWVLAGGILYLLEWVAIIGTGVMVAGAALVLAQLTVAPSTSDASGWLSLGVVLFWAWMIWAGVVLWRRTPSTKPVAAGR